MLELYRLPYVFLRIIYLLQFLTRNPESRRLEVRCGLKTKDQARKVYVHMLNGTLCATERALCCLVENHQDEEVCNLTPCLPQLMTPQGINIPEVLRPYMQGREKLKFVRELPKGLQKKAA
jgi:seryl-tRNA synthetase